MAMPRVMDKHVDAGRLHRIMAGTTMPSWPDMPIEIVSTGLPDIMMPVATVDDLNAMQPDMEALSELSREMEVTGVHAFALSDDGYMAHVRNFGPLYGINEESATGTANAALTHYLYRRGLITAPATSRFLQGEAMERPSVVATMLEGNGTVWVGGKSCILAEGEFLCIS